MLKPSDIISTVRMFREEHLDVRTITLGVNLGACRDGAPGATARAVGERIRRVASALVPTCDRVASKYGISVVNKRLAVSPVSALLEGMDEDAAVQLACAMDAAAADVGVDLIGGFSAFVQKGITPGERTLIQSIPRAMTESERVCSAINVGSTRAGLNVDAVLEIAEAVKRVSAATADRNGFGAAKLVVFSNAPEDNPFMAGATHGMGEPDTVINVGVSGPGVVKRAVDRALVSNPGASLHELAEEIKHTAYRVTRTGELLGREVASSLGVPFGIVDLSLAPTPRVGDSVGEIYQAMGIQTIGAPGTTAAVALLNDAVKKGGAFASSAVGGLSGAFIPVMEDQALAEAVHNGSLTLEKLEAMTAVCSVGLDMILLPGDTTVETLAGVMMDAAMIGIINRKTIGIRLIPVPGAVPGDHVSFGGLFGEGHVTNVQAPHGAETFVRRAGHIPAPIQSLTN